MGGGTGLSVQRSALGTSRRRDDRRPVLPWVLPIEGSCRTPGDPHRQARSARRPQLP